MNGYALLFTTAFMATSAAAQDNPVDLGTVTLNAGQRDERALLDSPVSATVIDRETLERRQAQDFNELIGDVPGVLIFGGPRSVSHTPSIRGFSDRQVVLRFDGGRMNFGQAHRGRFFLDPDLVQRVEVVRGGGSTLYGSGALGGVIAVETRDAADLLRPGQTTGARVSFGSSSNGDILKRNLSVYGDYGAVDFLAFIGDRRMGNNFEQGDDGPEIGASRVELQN
ncbi:MAG: TonB-dependent receptor plug domain-containing protein, partial [Pseudomonadota bacterium]